MTGRAAGRWGCAVDAVGAWAIRAGPGVVMIGGAGGRVAAAGGEGAAG